MDKEDILKEIEKKEAGEGRGNKGAWSNVCDEDKEINNIHKENGEDTKSEPNFLEICKDLLLYKQSSVSRIFTTPPTFDSGISTIFIINNSSIAIFKICHWMHLITKLRI